MESLLRLMVDNKLIDVAIGLVGIFGFALIIDRCKALYVDLSLHTDEFMKQLMGMVEQDKIEEAITFCSANEKKPLAFVLKRILEKSDRENEAMDTALDIAASEIGPKLTKNLGHLAMVSNVVTLVGLLGTVCGLIVAFKAVTFADVAQKQTLLAEGISIAMSATAAALMVAIPTMFIYSFLHSKQSRLFTEIDLHSNKLLDVLKNRGLMAYAQSSVYPNHMKSDAIPKGKVPPAPRKVA